MVIGDYEYLWHITGLWKSTQKDIEYFGPYEGEYLDAIVYVKGVDERKDAVGVGMRLFDMFDEMDLDVPIAIMQDRGEMREEGEEA